MTFFSQRDSSEQSNTNHEDIINLRIDFDTRAAQTKSEIQALEHRIQTLERDNDKMDRAMDKLEEIYVRIEEFRPVKNVIYGTVGIVLVGALGAMLASIGIG